MIFKKTTVKKFAFAFLFCTAFQLANAQWSAPDANGNIQNTNTGNVNVHIGAATYPSFGVGVTTNRANTIVQVANSLAVIGDNSNSVTTNAAASWNYYNVGSSPSWSGVYMQHVGTAVTGNQYGVTAANQGSLIFSNVTNAVIASNGGTNIYVSPQSAVSTVFLTNGNVLIGKTSQTNSSYKLDVAGDVRVNKVVVNTTGADFVFQPEYQLPSLHTVDAYIQANRHLPGVPSADSMTRAGLDVGSNQTILLQKIEELTLYSIQQQKTIEQLNERLSQLEKKKNPRKH